MEPKETKVEVKKEEEEKVVKEEVKVVKEERNAAGYKITLKRTKTGEEDGKEIIMKSIPFDPIKDEAERIACIGFKKKKLIMIVGYNGSEF
jgi:hypothetical protein